MTNLELAKEQGSQAAPNVIDAAKAGEVQIDITLAPEQGNQAAPLIADSLASSESYDAIKQQGNQAMPLIVDALAGGGSDTGFELLDFTEPSETDYHVPSFMQGEPGTYTLAYYGILHDGYNLPNFTKLSVGNVEYDIYPNPGQEPSTTGCYLMDQERWPIDSQEAADEYSTLFGIDVKVGDTIIVMNFALITEQVISGNVPFTLYADQDSWPGTLHEYVDTSADVYGSLSVNSDSTAYELTVYTDNCSNPYVKIGEDGEWQAYDENNKPSIYLPGDTRIYLKAINDINGSEVTGSSEYRITYSPNGTYQSYIVENPSNMFAGATLYINSGIHNVTGSLTGRDDVVLQYKVSPSDEWLTAQLTNTSAGYFAELNLGWGTKNVDIRITVSGELAFKSAMGTLDLKPTTPSFVDIINDQGTYYARLRFGANYPDMNTVETIEYSFDNENWVDAVHDAISGYELAEIQYYANSYTLPDGIWIRTKPASDSSIVSGYAYSTLDSRQVLCLPGDNYTLKINGKTVAVANPGNYAYIDILRDYNVNFYIDATIDSGYSLDKFVIKTHNFDTGTYDVWERISANPTYCNPNYGINGDLFVDVELQQQSPSDDNS